MNKLIILFYNTMWGTSLQLEGYEWPEDCIITTDRNLMGQADAVVFHLPDLPQISKGRLEKRVGQIWVAWNLECEVNYPWIKNEEFRSNFDLWMGYRQEDDIPYTYYSFISPETLRTTGLTAGERLNKTCMFVSNIWDKCNRREYLRALMKYTEIDSYGRVLNNIKLERDYGNRTYMEIASRYKFTIAFENSLSTDYVTEKFFNPLMAGCVPVYRGAPNIIEFAPGNDCFVDVSAFQTPEALASYINFCYEDEKLYARYFKWKKQPFLLSFTEKLEKSKEHPFICLYNKIRGLKKI